LPPEKLSSVAGIINSPQLLMLSGVGPKEVLQPLGISVIKDLKFGKTLQDHAASTGVFFTRPRHEEPQFSGKSILIDALN
jgi:choline dehydrogenase-like flavoprotein